MLTSTKSCLLINSHFLPRFTILWFIVFWVLRHSLLWLGHLVCACFRRRFNLGFVLTEVVGEVVFIGKRCEWKTTILWWRWLWNLWHLNWWDSMRTVNHASSYRLLLFVISSLLSSLWHFCHVLEVEEAIESILMRLSLHSSHSILIYRPFTVDWTSFHESLLLLIFDNLLKLLIGM